MIEIEYFENLMGAECNALDQKFKNTVYEINGAIMSSGRYRTTVEQQEEKTLFQLAYLRKQFVQKFTREVENRPRMRPNELGRFSDSYFFKSCLPKYQLEIAEGTRIIRKAFHDYNDWRDFEI